MDWAPIHTKAKNDDEHYANMQRMLKTGDLHFLIGGIADEKGIRPVTFIRNIDDGTAKYISDITPKIVEALLQEIGPLIHANVLDLKQKNAH